MCDEDRSPDSCDMRTDPTWVDLQVAVAENARERHPVVTHGIALETVLQAMFSALTKDQRIAAVDWLRGREL